MHKIQHLPCIFHTRKFTRCSHHPPLQGFSCSTVPQLDQLTDKILIAQVEQVLRLNLTVEVILIGGKFRNTVFQSRHLWVLRCFLFAAPSSGLLALCFPYNFNAYFVVFSPFRAFRPEHFWIWNFGFRRFFRNIFRFPGIYFGPPLSPWTLAAWPFEVWPLLRGPYLAQACSLSTLNFELC